MDKVGLHLNAANKKAKVVTFAFFKIHFSKDDSLLEQGRGFALVRFFLRGHLLQLLHEVVDFL